MEPMVQGAVVTAPVWEHKPKGGRKRPRRWGQGKGVMEVSAPSDPQPGTPAVASTDTGLPKTGEQLDVVDAVACEDESNGAKARRRRQITDNWRQMENPTHDLGITWNGYTDCEKMGG